MTNFKTISEYEVLRMARQRLEEKWDKAEDAGDEQKAELIAGQVAEITKRMEEIRIGARA